MPFDVTPESESAVPAGPPPDPSIPAPAQASEPVAPLETIAPAPGVPPPSGPSAGGGRLGDDFGGAVFEPRPQLRRRGTLLIGSLVAILVIVGIGGALASFGGGQTASSDPGRIYGIGEPVGVGSVTFTVLGVRAIPTTEYSAPEPGFTYIAVHIEAVNNSETTKVVSSLMQFSVRDSTGLTYEQTIAGDLVGSLDGIVPAGSRLRGEIAYEVPAGMTGLQLVISDLFSRSAVVRLY
ncbi:MAG: DUF4352 domain-containing protein [Actinomycetota bacterium]